MYRILYHEVPCDLVKVSDFKLNSNEYWLVFFVPMEKVPRLP